ncbi:MAG: hypothetical protein ABI002_14610 [Saprospiraceae bacterium]
MRTTNSNPSTTSDLASIMIKDPCSGFTYNVAAIFTELDQFFENQADFLDNLEDKMDFLPFMALTHEDETERTELLEVYGFLFIFKKLLKGIKRN